MVVAAKSNRRWPAMLLVVLAILASSLVQAPHADAAKKRPKCLGKKATIVGNKKANTLKGTKKADVIVGLGGNDRILGQGGADRICGGGGKDKILGGGGNDRMDGGKGNDECRQQAGTGPKKNCEGPKYQLTVSKAGSGSGTITSSPTGIDCGLNCSLSVVEGDSVSLTAAAASGSSFSGWAGACTGTSGCSVVISKAQSVIATFTANPAPPPPPSFSLAVTTSGTGSGTISSSPGGINCGSDCSEVYTQGTSVTLSVTSSTGSVFDGWSGACSGTGSCVLSMDAAKSVNASFTAVSYNLHVDRVLTGTGASGTVTSAPTGINCGTDCDEIYGHGAAVTLTATAGSGSRFSSWSGCDSGAGNPCSITLTSARTATATFVKVWDLGVTKDGTGSGTVTSSPSGINCGVSCTADFEEGSSVTLTPAPNSGSRFDSWSGCDSVAGNQCTVTMTGSKSVNATFIRVWSLTVTKGGSGSGTVTSSPTGINCGSDCTETYDQGTTVILTATAASGSRFGSWSGCDSVTGNQCTVNINSVESVTATFVKVWDLTVSKAGTGTGSVSSTPSGINCGSDCTETYDQGTSVTLTATASSGSRFDSWTGCDSTAGNECSVNMTAATSVTATFIKVWDLLVSKSGSGSGTVTSSPSGINCGSDCTETYDQGTSVTLTATAASGSRFDSWTGCDSTAGNECTVNVNAAESVTATFVKIWSLIVSKDGSGSGTVTSSPTGINCGSDCTETYDQGTSVTLTGTAASGSRFGSWSGCDSVTGNQCTVNINAVESVTATFVKVWDLTVTKAGTGTGSVSSTPSGINCGSDCTETYDQGTSVTLTATASSGSRFDSWTGCDSTAGNECTVNVNAAESVTATFVKVWDLTVSKDGSGSGSVTSSPSGINCGSDCTETYDQGTSVTLTGTAASGSRFGSWSGCDSTAGNECTVSMTAAKSVTATFVKVWDLTVSKDGSGSGTVTSSPTGINCGSDCTESYDQGTSVTLTGTAASGSRFGSWSGCDSTAGNECTVNINSVESVTATFVKVWDLTVTKTGGGTGSVTSSPSGINCGATCTAAFDQGASVTLTAAADSGSLFTGWSGSGCSGTGTCVVTMDAAKSVTADFTLGRVLTVTKSGTGAGTVTSSPAGINCGGDCSETYLDGNVVTLTATPDGTSTFTGWTGCDSPSGNQCTMTMNANKTVNAEFTRITFNLQVNRTMPNGSSGTVTSSPAGINCGSDCDEAYVTGTEVTLTATADSGSVFVSWSGCDSAVSNQCTVTMSSAKTVTATFKKVWDLTVTKNGGSGGGAGTVTSSPAGINCGGDCSETYDHGTVVTLTAVASAGSRFSGWSGEGCSGTGTCVVTMNATRNVTANFVKQWTLTVQKSGISQGTVTSSPAGINCGGDCSEVYDHGTVVTLTRASGLNFQGWSGGGCGGTGMTCVVTMTSDTTVTAAWT